MLLSRARLAMVPTLMVPERPLRPLMVSEGMPHRGEILGNSTNSTAMMGAPSRAIQPAVFAARSRGGRPTGMWLLTSAVSRPSRPISMEPAVSRLCDTKKLESRVKNPRKNTTKASRWARNSSVLRASSTTRKVTPASCPIRVR